MKFTLFMPDYGHDRLSLTESHPMARNSLRISLASARQAISLKQVHLTCQREEAGDNRTSTQEQTEADT